MSGFHYTRESGEGGQILVTEGSAVGFPLDRMLDKGRPPLRAAAEIGVHLADVLSIAATDQAVHGDIRPAHVKIGADGSIALEGFGILRRVTRAPEGTPDFAPADIYGVGLVLYAMLGAHPMGMPPKERIPHDDYIRARIVEIDFGPLAARPWVVDLRAFLCRMLAFAPGDRPAPLDAANVLRAVLAACPGEDLVAWARGWASVNGERPSGRLADEAFGGHIESTGFVPRAGGPRTPPSISGATTGVWTRERLDSVFAGAGRQPMALSPGRTVVPEDDAPSVPSMPPGAGAPRYLTPAATMISIEDEESGSNAPVPAPSVLAPGVARGDAPSAARPAGPPPPPPGTATVRPTAVPVAADKAPPEKAAVERAVSDKPTTDKPAADKAAASPPSKPGAPALSRPMPGPSGKPASAPPPAPPKPVATQVKPSAAAAVGTASPAAPKPAAPPAAASPSPASPAASPSPASPAVAASAPAPAPSGSPAAPSAAAPASPGAPPSPGSAAPPPPAAPRERSVLDDDFTPPPKKRGVLTYVVGAFAVLVIGCGGLATAAAGGYWWFVIRPANEAMEALTVSAEQVADEMTPPVDAVPAEPVDVPAEPTPTDAVPADAVPADVAPTDAAGTAAPPADAAAPSSATAPATAPAAGSSTSGGASSTPSSSSSTSASRPSSTSSSSSSSSSTSASRPSSSSSSSSSSTSASRPSSSSSSSSSTSASRPSSSSGGDDEPAPADSNSPYKATVKLRGRTFDLECGDGQTGTYTSSGTLTMRGTVTCLIKSGDAKGVVQFERAGSASCSLQAPKIVCAVN